MDVGIDRESAEQLLLRDTYTPEEVARLLDMDLYLIRHAARTGELRAAIVDHHILGIRREDVLAWLAARAFPPSPSSS